MVGQTNSRGRGGREERRKEERPDNSSAVGCSTIIRPCSSTQGVLCVCESQFHVTMFGSRGRSSSYASITDALPLQRQSVETEAEGDPQRKEQLKKLFELMDHHLASGAFILLYLFFFYHQGGGRHPFLGARFAAAFCVSVGTTLQH